MFGESLSTRAARPRVVPRRKTALVRIFLVHLSEIVRCGLRGVVGAADDLVVVGESDSVSGSTRGVSVCHPDVVIIDASLPERGVVDITRSVRSIDPRARCLVLGRSDREEARRIALAAGADGYLLEDARAEMFLEVLRRAARGEQQLASAKAARRTDPAAEPPPEGERPQLTGRERQVLTLIAVGLTNRQIGEQLGLAEKTVKNYVSALLAKLHVERRTQAAIYEMTHGGAAADGDSAS